MLQNCKIIFVLFAVSGVLYAREVPPEMGSTADCKVTIKMVDKTNRTALSCTSLKFVKEQEFLDSKFLRWGTIKTARDTYITIFLSNGVHGEQVYIFSKNDQKKINHITSSWPIEIESKKNDIKLHYKKDSDSKGEYPSHYYKFR